MGIGMGQLILVFLLALLFFGAKRLPEIAKAMGKAANEFQKAKNEILDPPTKMAEAETQEAPEENKALTSSESSDEQSKA